MVDLNPNFTASLTRLGLMALLLAGCIVVAARFRRFWGIAPIAVLAGLFQVLQLVLVMGTRIEVFPGATISPGAVAVFPATLFAILLVYVLEDEAEARRLVYGILLANVALALVIFSGQPLIDVPDLAGGIRLSSEAAARLCRIIILGSILLAIDALILIRAFEWFGDRVSRIILARALFALSVSLAFDALVLPFAVFGANLRSGSILPMDLIGKVGAAVFYSLAFAFLLPFSGLPASPTGRGRPNRSSGPVTYKDRFRDLQQVAVRDALTGVFNRAYFDHELRIQSDRAQTRSDGLLLLLIDLDQFKRINDTHGHPTGDRVLTLFGELLRAVARQNDTVCRYGGEEFAILIAGSPAAIAPRMFERMIEERNRLWALATPPFPFEAPCFSVGGAALPIDARTGAELLEVADRRLYASKRAGGNQLTLT